MKNKRGISALGIIVSVIVGVGLAILLFIVLRKIFASVAPQ